MIYLLYMTMISVAVQIGALFVENEPAWIHPVSIFFTSAFLVASMIAYDKLLDRIKQLERKVEYDRERKAD